ncbi:hypothetical protein FRC19_009608 [Serendipita sp. 401]|nr:hypothetical protein FRC16_006838 [Serendipita sp. 398]KAG8819686.1 hypothetical protein FRC19_009608 [Serendipita sp. 401]KAG9053003.1 hypothetical protein FS842_008912 [Serendipita sp. 407]
MHLLTGLSLLLAYALGSWAAYNTTIQYNDPAITYSPVNNWSEYPPSGCHSWTGARWPSEPGSIELKFKGTAIYAYSTFENNAPPIYTMQVDDGPTVNSGTTPGPTTLCDPIYAKTGLDDGEHTFKLVVTGDSPINIINMVFLGFIVTQSGIDIPSITGGGGGGGSGSSGNSSPSATSTSTSGGLFGGFGGNSGSVLEMNYTPFLTAFAALVAILQ